MATKKLTGVFLAVVFILTMGTVAMAQELIPGGKALGIKMLTDGVMVAGVQSVETKSGKVSPAEEAGIRKGDIITRIGAMDVSSAVDFTEAVQGLDGGKISVTVDRSGKTRQFNVTPAQAKDGSWKLGLMLRDGISGVGTLTFYDPATGIYGALGHSISDSETGITLPLGDGSIYDAQVVGIAKGEVGAPGALNGSTDEAAFLGDIQINCGCGIYGAAQFDGEPLETGDIKTGKASIYCTLEGDTVNEYRIEVKRVYENDGLKTVLITVTDPALIAQTGGIVQGMSGSPIIQEGKLVGAVTHVFVNDPTSGYGISIQDMLEQVPMCQKAA